VMNYADGGYVPGFSMGGGNLFDPNKWDRETGGGVADPTMSLIQSLLASGKVSPEALMSSLGGMGRPPGMGGTGMPGGGGGAYPTSFANFMDSGSANGATGNDGGTVGGTGGVGGNADAGVSGEGGAAAGTSGASDGPGADGGGTYYRGGVLRRYAGGYV